MTIRAAGWALGTLVAVSAAPCHAAFWWEGLGPFRKPGVVIVPAPCQRGCGERQDRAAEVRGTEAASEVRRRLEQDIRREIDRALGKMSPLHAAEQDPYR